MNRIAVEVLILRDPYGYDTRFKCPGLVTAAAQQKGHLHGGGIVI